MQKFLDQFALTPMQRVDMENFIYTQADRLVKGYTGGLWESHKVGNVWILVIPGEASEPVELCNPLSGNDITTDRLSASAAFSSAVSNWYMGLRYEQGRASDAMVEAISDYGFALSAASKELPDARAFYRFID